MEENEKKHRLNLYLSSDLLERLNYCATRYGVSRTQLAVILIGQGVAGIEKTFTTFNDIAKEFSKDLKNKNFLDNNN